MVWSRAELSSDDTTRHAADLPMLVYNNAALSPVAAAIWEETGSWVGSADLSATGHPAYRGYDEAGYLPTRSGTHGASLYYLMSLNTVSFDTIAVIGHNFSELSSLTSVSVLIADNNAYSSNPQTIAEWTSGFTTRLVETRLGYGLDAGTTVYASRYSGVTYAYLRIQYAGSGELPRFGEIFLGTRQALPNRAEMPVFEGTPLDGAHARFVAESGLEDTSQIFGGRFASTQKWRPDSTTYANQFRSWFAGTAYGRRHFLWIPNPSTSEATTYYCKTDPSFAVLPVAGDDREVSILFEEQAPFVSADS